MRATHLGGGIVKFDGVLSTDKNDVMSFLASLLSNTKPEGYSEPQDGIERNSGGYQHSSSQVKLAPDRYINVNFEGIQQADKETLIDLENSTNIAVLQYLKHFPSAATSVKWRTRGYVIKYERGQMIGPHSDASLPYADDGMTPLTMSPITNTLTCSIFLNDDFGGGELHFRPWGITVKPEFGSIVVYPSNFSGCHEITPVTSGTRFAYLSWFCHGVLNVSPPFGQKCDDMGNFSYYLEDISDFPVRYEQKMVTVGNLDWIA
jgi:hypothetical protein